MVPTLVIDARMIQPIPHGIARYVQQIAYSLSQRGVLGYRPLFLVNSDFSKPNLEGFPVVKLRASFLSPKELLEIPKVLRSLKASAYHSPSFSSPFHCPCPHLVTIHDLNHLTYGSLAKKIYYETLLKRFARKSKKIMTVSQFSQNEISQWLGLPSSEISVVYNSIDYLFQSQPKTEDLGSMKLEPGKYFLCISNTKPHKNLGTLIQAYQSYSLQVKNPWPLILSTNPIVSAAGVHYFGNLSDGQVRTLVQSSGGIFFPSLYEGFGLPPVEAAVSGIPIAVSQIPPHEEALQDLQPNEVLWVHPKDYHGWVSAFHKIGKKEIAPASVQTQTKMKARFSAANLGQSIDQVYRNVLDV